MTASKLTDQRVDIICHSIARGVGYMAAAQAAGISVGTLNRWRALGRRSIEADPFNHYAAYRDFQNRMNLAEKAWIEELEAICQVIVADQPSVPLLLHCLPRGGYENAT